MNPVPQMPPLECPDCGGELRLQPLPSNWRGGNPWVYLCENRPVCRGLCSAHPDGTPTGTPADAGTRRARNLTHKWALDPLWWNAPLEYEIAGSKRQRQAQARHIRKRARTRVYAWLADRLGIAVENLHVGQFDIETCRKVWRICKGAQYSDIRTWAKEKGL